MSDGMLGRSAADVIAALHGLLDQLETVSLDRDGDAALVGVLRESERLRRRLDAGEYRVINEVDARGIAGRYGAPSVGRLLRSVLRIDAGEANARVRAAAAAGIRRGRQTGEVLPPIFTHVAEAQRTGVVSQRQALLIEKTIDELPGEVAAEHGEKVELDLVRHAADFEPRRLNVIARRVVDHLDPDGVLKEYVDRDKQRDLHIAVRADGSSHVEGELNPECTERLLTVLDITAAPAPAADGTPDPRSPGMRTHDGLLAALDLLARCEQLPTANGVSATIVVTMTADQYLTGDGLARTGHGSLVPAADAIGWGGGDTEILAVAIDDLGAVTAYSGAHRIYTKQQRQVMAARDGGCTFPDCPAPPGLCQTNHIIEWQDGGPTSVSNGGLVCKWHHRLLQKAGWRMTMIHGIPHWISPLTIDPSQTPHRNTTHDPITA